MSRTDKDAPVWVKAEWFQPFHYFCDKAERRRGDRACDLPESPHRGEHYDRRFPVKHCGWDYIWWGTERPRWYDKPRNRDEVIDQWWGPVRTRTRDWCKEAMKRHRGNSEYDDIDPPGMHRHAPIKGWWW